MASARAQDSRASLPGRKGPDVLGAKAHRTGSCWGKSRLLPERFILLFLSLLCLRFP